MSAEVWELVNLCHGNHCVSFPSSRWMALNVVLGAAYVSDDAFASLDACRVSCLDQRPAIEGWVFPLLTRSSSVFDEVLPRPILVDSFSCMEDHGSTCLPIYLWGSLLWQEQVGDIYF